MTLDHEETGPATPVLPRPAGVLEESALKSADPPPGARHYSQGLNVLRGLAAVVVVCYHCLLTSRVGGMSDPQYMRLGGGRGELFSYSLLLAAFNGQACVTLFFVLSGAVLSMSIARRPPVGAREFIAYFVKRCFRIYPLLIASAAISAWLQMTFPQGDGGSLTDWFRAQHSVPRDAMPREFALNALGLRSSLNSAAWSIKVEILGSLLFPVIYAMSRSLTMVAIWAAVLLPAMLIPAHPRAFAYMNVFLICFLAGSALVRCGEGIGGRLSTLPLAGRIAILAAGFAALMISRRVIDPASFVPPAAVLVETLGASAVVAVILHWPSPARSHRSPARLGLGWLGDLSYSIYLIHIPLIVLIAPAISAARPDAGWLAKDLALAAAVLLSAYPLALCTYNFVERPFQSLGRRIATVFTRPYRA